MDDASEDYEMASESQDRLSELPLSLIFHILSFLPMKDVVWTSILSKRWKDLWTTVPRLYFCDEVDDEEADVERNFINGALLFWRGAKILKFKSVLDGLSMPLANDIDLWAIFAKKYKGEELNIDLSYDWDDAVEDSKRDIYIAHPALLELSAASPMYTQQRRAVNYFVPDSQMLFHVLSICDTLMNATDRFLRSAPAWLPIVSQLYISILWNVMILKVYVHTGYGVFHAQVLNELTNYLQIEECMIPGPLVPFFQALGAINGPFEWIGDIVPAIPNFSDLWNADSFHPSNDYARLLPIPAILLDQLHYFSQWPIPANQTSTYSHFLWYRNVFSEGVGTYNALNRLGPQLCGSLFTTQSQYDSARNFWNSALIAGITRTNAAAGHPRFSNIYQLFGFQAQNGSTQLTWFQHVTSVMQKYTQYFNGSVPLKSILPTGIGAVATYGIPNPGAATRNWLYPASNQIEPFLTSRFAALREMPSDLQIVFRHADHELEEQAEQYAILSHTNILWSRIPTQNSWTVINETNLRQGDYWQMTPFRFSSPVSYSVQFAQIILSRYHQQAANRVE